MIPKIIHQTAPKDESRWHILWKNYQQSWIDKFPDFEYRLWDDDALESLIKSNYRWFYDIYKQYDQNIKRIDAARYFILYEYGGMYTDMDFECLNNFWDQIPQDMVSIAETGDMGVCTMENALMISPKQHNFWLTVFNELIKNKKAHVFVATGPLLIENCINIYNGHINKLKREKYAINNQNNYSIHHQTGVWVNKESQTMEKIFTEKYESSAWGNNGLIEYSGSSGPGSSIEYNVAYIDFIKQFIIDNNISSVVDLGCGDWRIGAAIFPELNINYIGYDVYLKLITYLNNKFSNDKIKFQQLDIFNHKQEIKNADLLICKDVLQHWTDQYVSDFIDWLMKTGRFKYILITNCHTGLGDNIIRNNGQWYRGLGTDHTLFKNKNFKCVFKHNTKETMLYDNISHKYAIITQYSNQYNNLANLTWYNNKIPYCTKHGYYHEVEELTNTGSHNGQIQKVKFINRMLQCPNYSWIWWSDGDLMITNFLTKIEDKIDNAYDMIIATDSVHGINAGSILIKNSDNSRKYWQMIEKELPHCGWDWEGEQGIIKRTYNEWKNTIKIVPQREINAYDYSIYGTKYSCIDSLNTDGNWKYGDWVIHWPGTGLEHRINLAKNYSTQILK